MADLTLGHRPKHAERLGGDHGCCFLLDGQVADLGPVSVGDDDPPPCIEQPGYRPGHPGGVASLLLECAFQRPARERVAPHR